MSYDLNFWKEPDGLKADPLVVYRSLCEGQPFDGLSDIDVDEFHKRIINSFQHVTERNGYLDWEGKDTAFQVSSSPQHIRVDCYGKPGQWMNVFIDIGKELGCPLYDPQINERFVD